MRTNKVKLRGRSFRAHVLKEIRKGNLDRDKMLKAGISHGIISRMRNQDDDSVGHVCDTMQKCYEMMTGNKLEF